MNKSSYPEYGQYKAMIHRCYDPKNNRYYLYGGRGIKVCASWLGENGFWNFIADLGRRPGEGFSLERLKNDQDYCPGNVKWATKIEQARNKRSNRVFTVDGLTGPLSALAEAFGLPYKTVHARIKSGWEVNKALKTPVITDPAPYLELGRQGNNYASH